MLDVLIALIAQSEDLLLLGLELLLGGVADLTVLDGTTAGDLAVDGAGDAVALLHVQLGHGQASTVQGGGSLSDITGGSGIQDVTDDEALDGLILGGQATAVHAVDGGGAATAVLGATIVTTLGGHVSRSEPFASSLFSFSR